METRFKNAQTRCHAARFQILTVRGQGTAFTYQGRLNDGNAGANGSYDLQFNIFDAVTNGATQGSSITNAATIVSNGLFTVTLDFGAGIFDGSDRWLEIGVRTNGGGGFTTLSPRQKLTPTPYAIMSGNAASVSGSVSAAQLTGTISSNNIGTGSITTVMLAAGAVGSNQLASGAVTTGALADGAVTAAKIASSTGNVLLMTFTNPAPAVGDAFGYRVAALDSRRMLIGAVNDSAGATNSGSAYLFNDQGTLLATIPNPTPATNDNFSRSLATVGSNGLLIGCPGDDTGTTNAGSVYLFNTNGALLVTFTNPAPAAGDQFGSSVAALGSDRVIIGATQAPAHPGTVYVFRTDGALLTTITNPVPTNNADFGYSVAAVGKDRILVGAIFQKSGAATTGAAYLFDTNGVLTTTYTNPMVRPGEFGLAVAGLGSGHALIGAPFNVSGGTNAGAAYLYNTNGTLEMTFTNPAALSGDQFGVSLAAVGNDRVLVGANQGGAATPSGGVAYLFSTNGALLLTYTNPTPLAFDGFGFSVAVAGDSRVLIGALGDDVGASSAGVAYLYLTADSSYTPGLIAEGVRADSITTASLQDGAVTASKIGGVLLPSQIPDLDASKIVSGTLADTRLSSNVALRAGGNIFSNDQILASGKLGIGTPSPVAKLHVAGDATVNGLFALASATIAPTAGSSLPATNSYVKLSPAVSVILSGTTAISNGAANGNLLILQGGPFSTTISNAANTRLGATTRVLSLGDTLTLVWDGNDWVEVSFSNN